MANFAHSIFDDISTGLLETAKAALKLANKHAVEIEQRNEHWERLSILNAVHAGELFIKAAISRVHPLLIFQNPADFPESPNLSIEMLVNKGKSHDLAKLPTILWAATGRKLAARDVFDKARSARNSVEHFIPVPNYSLGDLSLKFIYEVIDPLILEEFGLYAIECNEDRNGSYDYIVDAIVSCGLKFSIPPNFDMTDIPLFDSFDGQSANYKAWLSDSMRKLGKSHLLDKPRITGTPQSGKFPDRPE